MRHVATAAVAVAVAVALAALSAPRPARADRSAADKPVVLLNASAKLGDLGPVDKLRRVLESRGLLFEIPAGLAATFDGRSLEPSDLDAIRDAYGDAKFEEALQLVEDHEARVLQRAGGDPLPALAELAKWRGLIALGLDDPDGAVAWFRAALRFNPAWTLESALAGPKVARLVKKARKEATETGKLRIDAEPAAATVAVDGGRAQPAAAPLTLPAGHHLVTITAEGRTSYSEVVEIVPGKTAAVAISLDAETRSDLAARLVDATVAAPTGAPRLRQVKGVSRFVGATRFLVIEDTTPERAIVRVYDVDLAKVSQRIDLEGSASSAAIARKVLAALDPENLIDARTVIVVGDGRPKRWYERWYVWAGVAGVLGGGALGYHYLTRDPTSVRGF